MTDGLPAKKRRLFFDLAHTLMQIPAWAMLPRQTRGSVAVGDDAFGVNVATSADPRCDDYVVARLREAGIQHVRLCWDSEATQNFTRRFLERLLAEGFDVMVALVPSFHDAKRLESDAQVVARWQTFVREFFTEFGTRVTLCEIGNTPNRPRWSGYTPTGYLIAWEAAAAAAREHNVTLAGPNVSDFEPAFNHGYLRNMQRSGTNPAVHTDNLFVERAVEPEQFDPSAAGKHLSNAMQLNLAKKISLLSAISKQHGVPRTFCTYTCWTHKRLSRWTVFPDAKSADYLTRYLVVCAAAEGMDRVYWGPLIDGRDGLIDCGSDEYPIVDNVTHYKSVRGEVERFRPNPAFYTYGFITRLLKNTFCHSGVGSRHGVNHYVFSDAHDDHHIMWAPDRRAFQLRALYDDYLDTARVRDIRGNEVTEADVRAQISESPLILTWPKARNVPLPDASAIHKCPTLAPLGTVLAPRKGTKVVGIDADQWQGVARLAVTADASDANSLLPENIKNFPIHKVLRDKRNRLWSVDNPTGNGRLVIKENRARGIKRLSYLFLQSKGKRHWNTATEMLRRGVNTPAPVAYLERRRFAGVKDNYYIAQCLEDAFSTRDLFTAFAAGETSYRGIDKEAWLKIVARFVALMHRKKFIHRDLSSGNLMITLTDGKPTVYVIDIGRARVDTPQTALVDIKRICHKLSWPDRELFVAAYEAAIPRQPLGNWRAAARGYDRKLNYKKRLKGLITGKRKARARVAATTIAERPQRS